MGVLVLQAGTSLHCLTFGRRHCAGNTYAAFDSKAFSGRDDENNLLRRGQRSNVSKNYYRLKSSNLCNL
jgi:hypothetical protein